MRLFKTYKKGDSGVEVKFLQRSLPWWCWSSPAASEADGQYGSKTVNAVKIFQSSKGLTEDGVAGEETLRKLQVWSDVVAGIDISSYQTVDWSEVNPEEFSCVWAKATEGKTYQDTKFVDHVHGARGRGLAVGAYHFATLNNEPWAEADNFLEQIHKAGQMDLPPVLDFEKASDDDTLQWLLAFLRQVQSETNSTPVLYSGAWRINALKGPVSLLTEFGYWIPSWGPQPAGYGPFCNWSAWQWTNEGRVSGINGNVDRNWLLSDLLGKPNT